MSKRSVGLLVMLILVSMMFLPAARAQEIPQQGNVTPLVTDLGLADLRLAVLHPNLLFRQWDIRNPGDVMGTGSFYLIDPALEESRDELDITVLANPMLLDLDEWIKLRQEPVDAAVGKVAVWEGDLSTGQSDRIHHGSWARGGDVPRSLMALERRIRTDR